MFGLTTTQIFEVLSKNLLVPFLLLVYIWYSRKDQDSLNKANANREKMLTEQIVSEREKSQLREDVLIEHMKESDSHMRRSDETMLGIMRSVEKISDAVCVVQKDVEILKER